MNRFLFQQTHSFETGISDHPYLITFMLKITFERFLLEVIIRYQKLDLTLIEFNLGILQSVISKNLKTDAPFKECLLRGKNKLHITSHIRKEIMARNLVLK